MTDTTEVKRFEPYTDEGNREGYGQMEMCENGDWVRAAASLGALAAKLAEQIEWVKRLADDLIAAEGREARLKAKLAEVEAERDALDDPRVEALVTLINRAQDIIDPCYPAKHAVWQNDARDALLALEENK